MVIWFIIFQLEIVIIMVILYKGFNMLHRHDIKIMKFFKEHLQQHIDILEKGDKK